MTYFVLLLLHIGVAFAIYLYRPLALLYLLGTFTYFIIQILRNANRQHEALMAAAYLAGAEIFLRMTQGVIFYETGKYGVIFFLGLGMCFKGFSPKAVVYWIYMALLVPAVLIASQNLNYEEIFRKTISFNLSGAACIGVCAVYCYYNRITANLFHKALLMMLLPIIAHMAYLYFYVPPLAEIVLNTTSNMQASGDFGPNQISTIMGMGAFLLIIRFFYIRNSLKNITELLLLGLISFRAIATFSRGGVITAMIATAVFVFLLYFRKNTKYGRGLNFKVLLLMVILLVSWLFSAVQTSGLILNRYTNRDLSGNYKSDLTTGRAQLLTLEFSTFSMNPLVGAGVGKAAELRKEKTGRQVATHNEFTRLLSEHGLLGLLAILILILAPLLSWTSFRNNPCFLPFLCFWFLTSSHSALRMALPALVYGLALLHIVDEKKNSLYR